MEPLKSSLTKQKNKLLKRNPHLHGPNHVLADELCTILRDPKHFVIYLKFAEKYPHEQLLKVAKEIAEQTEVETPGKLFSYKIKHLYKK